MYSKVSIAQIKQAANLLDKVANRTSLNQNINLSEKYESNIYLKREDLQVVRSYKLRGAYNKIVSIPSEQLTKGIVCASAGNHAQGVAYSCQLLKIKGTIFMPSTTPKQKINQVKMFGKSYVDVCLMGDTFDDAYNHAKKFSMDNKITFIHPFDDIKIIEGQATVGLEILDQLKVDIDYIFVPIGGGGLVAGIISCFKVLSPNTKIIGVEPEGAPAMFEALKKETVITLQDIDKFVDGAAVKKVGELNFQIAINHIDKIILVPEGKVCSTIISLYNEEAIVAEPAGALTIAALDFYQEEIKGKNVVCIISGGNNDLARMEEIKERSLMYEGLKHYFIINFPQRAGALREFLNEVLGPNDDITQFEFTKKNMKEYGPAFVGIELKQKEDYLPLIERLQQKGIEYENLKDNPNLFTYFI